MSSQEKGFRFALDRSTKEMGVVRLYPTFHHRCRMEGRVSLRPSQRRGSCEARRIVDPSTTGSSLFYRLLTFGEAEGDWKEESPLADLIG